MKKKNIDMKIDKSIYNGYLWFSDKNSPQIILGEEFEMELDDNTNPFVVEGWLADDKKSVSIRYVDGHHIVRIWNLEELNACKTIEEMISGKVLDGSNCKQREEFVAHRMGHGIRKLVFYRYWRLDNDGAGLCENMAGYVPAELVFVGFDKNEK